MAPESEDLFKEFYEYLTPGPYGDPQKGKDMLRLGLE
jgi:hypothetical protein